MSSTDAAKASTDSAKVLVFTLALLAGKMSYRSISLTLSLFFSSTLLFSILLHAGTVCSLTSKIMLSLKSIGITNEIESFSFPLFQTFAMFFGMSFGLLFHRIVILFKIPFPGYSFISDEAHNKSSHSDESQYDSWEEDELEDDPSIPVHMFFYLAIPAVFDLIATILCMYGLLFITVSTYQILRGIK